MPIVSITYPLAIPGSPGFRDSNFGLQRVVGVNKSPFSLQQQVQEWEGAAWIASISLPPMSRAQARFWHSFFMKLHGRAGTFRMGDPDATSPLSGLASGSPTVLAGSPSFVGNQIDTESWGANNTQVLDEGDYVQIGDWLYMIVVAATTDGSGNATLQFEPDLRAPLVGGEAVVYTNPKTLFRMDSNMALWSADHLHIYGISFSATEALPVVFL